MESGITVHCLSYYICQIKANKYFQYTQFESTVCNLKCLKQAPFQVLKLKVTMSYTCNECMILIDQELSCERSAKQYFDR